MPSGYGSPATSDAAEPRADNCGELVPTATAIELALLDPQVAREYGVADLDENDEWVVGDVSRLGQ